MGLQKEAASSYQDCLAGLRFRIPDKQCYMTAVKLWYSLTSTVSRLQSCLPQPLRQTEQ